jgi:two-component system, OmpR family, alkaline phosphatase synthesis response regulator PhoP
VGKKVIVVDDEAHILHVLMMKLRNAGYDVITAVDGEEALDLCLTERPDMIITDFQMPLKTGLELCREVHRHPAMRSIPAMMLTARDFDVSSEDLAEAGISAIMAKPFAPREVLAKVRQLLGEPQTSDALE